MFDKRDETKPFLMIFHGLPGSGKSTLAKEMCKQFNAVCVSRDDIRESVAGFNYFNGPQSRKVEEQVSVLQKQMITEALLNGQNVFSEDTNLNPRTVSGLVKLAYHCGADVRHYHMNVPLEVCLERNRLRGVQGGRLVPEEVILKMESKAYETVVVDGVQKRSIKKFVHSDNGSVFMVSMFENQDVREFNYELNGEQK